MIHHGAAAGAFNLETTLLEVTLQYNNSKLCFLIMFCNHSLQKVATSMRRAGADVIISYFTPKLLNLIKN